MGLTDPSSSRAVIQNNSYGMLSSSMYGTVVRSSMYDIKRPVSYTDDLTTVPYIAGDSTA